MQAYLNTLKTSLSKDEKYNYLQLNRTNPVVTYHFHMALYLQHDLVDFILDKIAMKMPSNNLIVSMVRVPIQYLKDENFKNTKGLNFTILIRDSGELAHARHLLQLWTRVIKPFVEANKSVFDNLTFSRLFAFSGPVTNWMCGNY